MTYRDEATDLRLQIRSESYALTEHEQEEIERDLGSLRKVVRDFPVAELHLDIRHHPQSRDFHVRANLHVTKHDFFTGERETTATQAVERCVRKLVNKIKCFKQKRAGKPRQSRMPKGEMREISPDWEPDLSALEQAVAEKDYPDFRVAIRVYDESLSKRLGRWIARYPAIEAQLGEGVTLSEILEEIYLNAFESFEERSAGPVSDWLEHLIDPSVRGFMPHT